MSGQAFVVMPVGADATQQRKQETEKIASAIQQSLYEQTHPKKPEPEQNGPLKELLAHQDSLYKYINWEDPVGTVCSYMIALSILLGMHYLPLTQLALKAGALVFGVISFMEFFSRSFGPNTFLARLRPKKYKKLSEPTLNATLKDIHDFIQYSVVQTQRILYGEDLGKSFGVFFTLTAMYWLTKIASPFALSILGLTSLYAVPLILSPRGRAVGKDAMALAGDLANKTADNGKAFAHEASAKMAEQSSRVQDAAMSARRHVGDVAENGKQAAVDMSTRAKDTVWSRPDATNGAATSSSHDDTYGHQQQSGSVDSGLVDRKPAGENTLAQNQYRATENSLAQNQYRAAENSNIKLS